MVALAFQVKVAYKETLVGTLPQAGHSPQFLFHIFNITSTLLTRFTLLPEKESTMSDNSTIIPTTQLLKEPYGFNCESSSFLLQ